jgi:transcriptional regulator with XRE-family HTH domain
VEGDPAPGSRDHLGDPAAHLPGTNDKHPLEIHGGSLVCTFDTISVLMISADLLREARLRAGLTQAELGRRVSRSQSQIARWERGDVKPSLETLRDLIRACGFELTFRLANYDDSYVADIEQYLDLSPQERVDYALRRAEVYREIAEAAV